MGAFMRIDYYSNVLPHSRLTNPRDKCQPTISIRRGVMRNIIFIHKPHGRTELSNSPTPLIEQQDMNRYMKLRRARELGWPRTKPHMPDTYTRTLKINPGYRSRTPYLPGPVTSAMKTVSSTTPSVLSTSSSMGFELYSQFELLSIPPNLLSHREFSSSIPFFLPSQQQARKTSQQRFPRQTIRDSTTAAM